MADEGSATKTSKRWTAGRVGLMVVHWGIILNLAFEFAYAGWMVFSVLRPPGIDGPLGARAMEIPHELMVVRRMYATEAWIAFGALAVYLALTEIGPRLKRYREG